MKFKIMFLLAFMVSGCDALKSPPNKTVENEDYRCDLTPERTSSFTTQAGFTLVCEAKKQPLRLSGLEISVTERMKVQANKSTRKTEVIGVMRPNNGEAITLKPGKPYTIAGEVRTKNLSSLMGSGTGRTMNARAKITYPGDKRSLDEIEKEREANRQKYTLSLSKPF